MSDEVTRQVFTGADLQLDTTPCCCASLREQLAAAQAEVERLVIAQARLLACHEDDGGMCFDCRRALALDDSASPHGEWTKYFAALNAKNQAEVGREAAEAEASRLRTALEAMIPAAREALIALPYVDDRSDRLRTTLHIAIAALKPEMKT